ncbi:cytochrome P450 [Polychaeton citri CBS 116435]|uniref:Cytochrome P450 n=1 Tax=Polychaeton citri CBS 116435 TaxID=1314669 RepID=A0A9P4Q838_9PEZI|nr:cytochrome P450 [Polychaeton citri CBS 116435]
MIPFVAGCFLVYLAALAVYRLYLSPLAKFPGPKVAALTTWYNAYHDLVLGGQFVWTVEDMHRKYGPIVRNRPDTLHVSDPRFMEKLYTQSPKQRRERYYTVTQGLQAPGSILATDDHDIHRRRRAVLNPFFSLQNVRRLEPTIKDTLTNLFRRFEGWASEGKPVQLNTVFRAATKDVIQAYALGEGKKYLDMDDCNAAFFDILTPQRICHLGTHVYWLAKLLNSLPPSVVVLLIPRVAVFMEFMQSLIANIESIRNSKELPEGKTIFHEIIRSDTLPDSEKQTKRLADEAMVFLFAGSETTASTLCAIMYQMLSDRKAFNRLKAELASVTPANESIPDAAKLDQLEYLNAVIQEGIRLYPGATHRQDRVAPDEDLIYSDPSTGRTFTIPAGTAIGMTAPISNRATDIYGPDANEFIPDRYIENPKLRQYLLSFSKGTRQCIGMNLAYQELQTFIAGIVHKYDLYDSTKEIQDGSTLELYKTERRDVAMFADYITPAVWPESKGLRVIIRH